MEHSKVSNNTRLENTGAIVGVIMGSKSDFDIMEQAVEVLEEFGVSVEVNIVSAHRTPDAMSDYAKTAKERGIKVIIAGAGGSAHLPGMTASHTVLPVLAVPIKRMHHDHESLSSSIMMPKGIPLGVLPENSAYNAGLFAIEILALQDEQLAQKYVDYKTKLENEVTEHNIELNESRKNA